MLIPLVVKQRHRNSCPKESFSLAMEPNESEPQIAILL